MVQFRGNFSRVYKDAILCCLRAVPLELSDLYVCVLPSLLMLPGTSITLG